MTDRDYMLDHERLDVYQLARELARTLTAILARIPPGRADLIDQARRTSLSIPLNIAEGGGEFAPKEKARFYRIAKRSATETSAVLDHMADIGLLAPADLREPKALLRRIVGALTKLILSTERQTPATRPEPPSAPARDR